MEAFQYKQWWSEGDLNPRHADFQSAALPTELPDHIKLYVIGFDAITYFIG